MDNSINMSTTLTIFTLVYYILFISYYFFYVFSSKGFQALWDFIILIVLFACITVSLTNYFTNYYGKEPDATTDLINVIVASLFGMTSVLIFAYVIITTFKRPQPQVQTRIKV